MTDRVLVIGLDGASFNVLDPLIGRGVVPNLASLIAGGVRANLETTFPPITAVAWSSFMTGKNPGKHGIFEFTRTDRNSSRELAVNASFRHGKAIWDLLSDAGKRVIVHNFPCTYPPRALNGVLIADFMTPRGRTDYTYPVELLAELENQFGPYRLHLSQTYAGAGPAGVLDELIDELEYKREVTRYLMTHYEWDAFFQYFWGTDRIQHELWHLIDEEHPRYDRHEAARYRDQVFDYFHRVDEVVGELIELAGPNSMTWVASDHGFGPAHKYCSFNVWLLHEGFIQLKKDGLTRLKRVAFDLGITPELAFKVVKKLPLGKMRPARGVSNKPGASRALSRFFLSFNDVDWSRTLAFSKGNYGQIYVNLKGREPSGAVESGDYDAVVSQIVNRLESIKDPLTGERWIGPIHRRDEIYSGPRVDDAPDVSFLPRDMRYLPLGNADFTSNRFMVDAFGISGCHRMHGVLIGKGKVVRNGVDLGDARIYDVAPTLLYLLGLAVPEDMDGRVLSAAIMDEHLAANAVGVAAAAAGTAEPEVEFGQEENADVLDRLKNLGYLG